MASISVSFSPVSQPATKAASQLNGMLQAAVSMQGIRRITDPNVSEAMKEAMLKPLRAQNQVFEDEVVRKSEEKEKATAVASAGAVSDAVTASAQTPADGAAAQTAADGTPVPADAAPAPQPVSTYTPDAVVSQPSTAGSTVDTYA